MPRSRRQVLSIVGGSLFAVNLFVLMFALQSAVHTSTSSPAQFAGSALATTGNRIILIADPERVTPGQAANIGWVTEGMKTCVISSPDLPEFTEENKSYTNVNGGVKTLTLTSATEFVLSCATLAGSAYPPESLTVDVLP